MRGWVSAVVSTAVDLSAIKEREEEGGRLISSDAVCAVCGAAPTRTVMLFFRGSVLEKDLCEKHLEELLDGARTEPRRIKAAEDRPGSRSHPSRPQE